MVNSEKDRRFEDRFPVETQVTVEVTGTNEVLDGTSINASGGGLLLRFEEAVKLAVGDEVMCDIKVNGAHKPLPHWGLGHVVRIEGNFVGIELSAACLHTLEPDTNVLGRPGPDDSSERLAS